MYVLSVIFFPVRVFRLQKIGSMLAKTLKSVTVHFMVEQRKGSQYAERTEYSVPGD
jgi:hypothetical protein